MRRSFAVTLLNYKFRIYPTKEQELVLEQTLDGCRWVYNYFLSMPKMSEYDMNYALTELKEQHPWLRNYHSKMLQMVCKQIAAARKSAIGRLKYRKDEDYNSFTYNQTGFRLLDNNKLILSKIGAIKIVMHRKPINVKQVTICRKNGKWYAVAACQILRRQYSTIRYYLKPVVGIDVGITKFAHDSDNHVIDNPQFLTKMLRPVKRAHRRVSRRRTGSNNRKKAKHMLAKLYERIHNKRKDFLHKTSDYYSKHHDLIFLERLKILNMTKNHKLARKILDASWSTFKLFLQYKANRVVEVPSPYTTIRCSKCGHDVPKSLAVRTHACSNCMLEIDRDYNASLNILKTGLATLPQELREVTPAETIQRSRKQEARDFSRG